MKTVQLLKNTHLLGEFIEAGTIIEVEPLVCRELVFWRRAVEVELVNDIKEDKKKKK